jgi:hypothetical protein
MTDLLSEKITTQNQHSFEHVMNSILQVCEQGKTKRGWPGPILEGVSAKFELLRNLITIFSAT